MCRLILPGDPLGGVWGRKLPTFRVLRQCGAVFRWVRVRWLCLCSQVLLPHGIHCRRRQPPHSVIPTTVKTWRALTTTHMEIVHRGRGFRIIKCYTSGVHRWGGGGGGLEHIALAPQS